MAFQSRRHLSRQGNIAKRQTQSELAQTIAARVEDTLLKHDPSIRKPALHAAGRLAGAIAAAIAVQTQAVQRAFPIVYEQLEAHSHKFVDSLIAELVSRQTGQAVGGSAPLAPSLGNRGPVTLPDEWAGPVAGPTLLERRYGLARSTLFRWMKRGEVVSIRTKGNRPVFPLMQFVDGRPADGISELIALFGDTRRAWQWLMSEVSGSQGRGIDFLLAGNVQAVLAAARAEISDRHS